MAKSKQEKDGTFRFHVKAPDQLRDLFRDYKAACLSPQAREASYLEFGEYATLELDPARQSFRIVPLKEL